MTKAMQQKWIRALTSGKFKQWKGSLKYGGQHCCLGVLCEINGITSLEGKEMPSECDQPLPPAARLHYGTQERLAYLNDHDEGDSYDAVLPAIRALRTRD